MKNEIKNGYKSIVSHLIQTTYSASWQLNRILSDFTNSDDFDRTKNELSTFFDSNVKMILQYKSKNKIITYEKTDFVNNSHHKLINALDLDALLFIKEYFYSAKITESRDTILKKIFKFINVKSSKFLDKDSIENLKEDVENNRCSQKSVSLFLALPPYVSHFQLALLYQLFLFACLGYKINLILQDVSYKTLSKNRPNNGADWPSKTLAMVNFFNFLDSLPEILLIHKDIYDSFSIYFESDLISEGHLLYPNFFDFRDDVIISSEKTKAAFKATSIYRKGISGYFVKAHSLINEFFFGADTLQSDYVLIGIDRIKLWKIFLKNRGLFTNQPNYIVLKQLPALYGNTQINLDSGMFFLNRDVEVKFEDYTTRFIKWFQEAFQIFEQKFNNNNLQRYLSDVQGLFSSPNNFTVESFIKSNWDDMFLGCYCFGGVEYINDQKNFHYLAEERMKKTSKDVGDIDLLFIVDNKKDGKIIVEKIYKILGRFGKVVFHPDFYSKRTKSELVFEVIVLPKNSTYFSSKGILTGLSAFSNGRFRTIKGPDLDSIIELPKLSNYKTRKKRASAYIKCDYGINHMKTLLFTNLKFINPVIDFKRVIKYILIDYAWVISGQFIFDYDKLSEFYIKYDNHFFSDLIKNKLNLNKEKRVNHKELSYFAYELINLIGDDNSKYLGRKR